MKLSEPFSSLAGEWTGTKRLHTVWMPETPVHDSPSTASVRETAGGHFLQIEYDWNYENDAKSGTLLISLGKEGAAENVWFDSFHQSGGFLHSKGTHEGARADVKGHYAVPGHADWGWETTVEALGPDAFTVVMHNISPEGERFDAVEMKFARKS